MHVLTCGNGPTDSRHHCRASTHSGIGRCVQMGAGAKVLAIRVCAC